MARAGAHDTIVRELSVVGSTGFFGGDLNDQSDQPLRFGHGEGVRVVRFSRDSFGCSTTDNVFDGAIVLVRRGECTFLEKLLHARDAGSSGIVVISDEEQGVNPSADAADLAAAGELDNVAIVLLTKSDGASVAAMMDSIEADGNGEFSVVVQLERQSSSREEGKGKTNKILYLNGHPLHNTRFLF
jgi:mannosidase alpha-like ER degradation enhancer 1